MDELTVIMRSLNLVKHFSIESIVIRIFFNWLIYLIELISVKSHKAVHLNFEAIYQCRVADKK